jgi:Fic family protein
MYIQLIEFLKKNIGKIITIKELLEYLNIPRKTLYRYIDEATEEWYIERISHGKYSIKQNAKLYLQIPFFDRKHVSYNPDFLRSYTPNISSFLWLNRDILSEKTRGVEPMATLDYMKNRRAIENLLIDLSYTSSKMEGNTYSYLDTEVLIKYNEAAEGKKKEETQMILNHKNAIEYLIAWKNIFHLTKQEFCELHTLLGRWLIHDTYLGIFRTSWVQIGGSRYLPPDTPSLIEWEFSLFLEKLRQIESPFEQSLFILVFVPYFQAFIDINKRTSRLGSNIPLIARWLPPLSLLQVKERDYIDAVLAIYELCDPSLMAQVFTENYLLNMHRYM